MTWRLLSRRVWSWKATTQGEQSSSPHHIHRMGYDSPSQHHRIICVGRSGSPTPLQWPGTPTARTGCSQPCPVWPWMSSKTGLPSVGNLFQCLTKMYQRSPNSPLYHVKLAFVVSGLLQDSLRCCPPLLCQWRLFGSALVVSLHDSPGQIRAVLWTDFNRKQWEGYQRGFTSACMFTYSGFGKHNSKAKTSLVYWLLCGMGNLWCSTEPWMHSASWAHW